MRLDFTKLNHHQNEFEATFEVIALLEDQGVAAGQQLSVSINVIVQVRSIRCILRSRLITLVLQAMGRLP